MQNETITPLELAWAAAYFCGGETEITLAELDRALGGSEYSRPDRAEVEQAIAAFRTDGDLVTDPTLRVLTGIWLHSPHDDVQTGALAALHELLDNDAGGPVDDLHRAAVLAMLATDCVSPSPDAKTARRVAHDLIGSRRQFEPEQIAWAAARHYAQCEWDGLAEPEHALMQAVDPALRVAAWAHKPDFIFEDSALLALIDIAVEFEEADEPGAADAVFGAAKTIVRRARPELDQFDFGLALSLLQLRANDEISATTASHVFDQAMHLRRDE
jgi:hypothetical protein